MARTVSIADKAKADPQAVELLKTSPRSFTIPNLKQKEVKFDPKTDTAGPLSLGVAASRMSRRQDARLVVIGDSDFAANQWVGLQHNGDLFFNTIDWLAQDENLISIRPKAATNRRVTLTAAQATVLRWLDFLSARHRHPRRNRDLVEAAIDGFLRKARTKMVKNNTLIVLLCAVILGGAVYYFDFGTRRTIARRRTPPSPHFRSRRPTSRA